MNSYIILADVYAQQLRDIQADEKYDGDIMITNNLGTFTNNILNVHKGSLGGIAIILRNTINHKEIVNYVRDMLYDGYRDVKILVTSRDGKLEEYSKSELAGFKNVGTVNYAKIKTVRDIKTKVYGYLFTSELSGIKTLGSKREQRIGKTIEIKSHNRELVDYVGSLLESDIDIDSIRRDVFNGEGNNLQDGPAQEIIHNLKVEKDSTNDVTEKKKLDSYIQIVLDIAQSKSNKDTLLAISDIISETIEESKNKSKQFEEVLKKVKAADIEEDTAKIKTMIKKSNALEEEYQNFKNDVSIKIIKIKKKIKKISQASEAKEVKALVANLRKSGIGEEDRELLNKIEEINTSLVGEIREYGPKTTKAVTKLQNFTEASLKELDRKHSSIKDIDNRIIQKSMNTITKTMNATSISFEAKDNVESKLIVVTGTEGVGKTFTALGVANKYTLEGKVLLVDLDFSSPGLSAYTKSLNNIAKLGTNTLLSDNEITYSGYDKETVLFDLKGDGFTSGKEAKKYVLGKLDELAEDYHKIIIIIGELRETVQMNIAFRAGVGVLVANTNMDKLKSLSKIHSKILSKDLFRVHTLFINNVNVEIKGSSAQVIDAAGLPANIRNREVPNLPVDYYKLIGKNIFNEKPQIVKYFEV